MLLRHATWVTAATVWSPPIAPTSCHRNRALLYTHSSHVHLALVAGILAFHWPHWVAAEGGLLRAFTLGNALFIAMRLFLGVLAPLGLA